MNVADFVKNIEIQCARLGTTPTTACRESGAGSNLMTNLKNGSVPSVERVQMLATYLGVTTSELLGEEKGPSTVADAEADLDAELIARLMQLTPEEAAKVDAFVQGLLAAR